MPLSEFLLPELDVEAPYTRQHLERVPMGRLDFKPHERSMTLGWLATRAAVTTASDEQLRKPWSLLAGGNVVFSRPRFLVYRTYFFDHMVHHRAQLGVFLRLNGIAVPAVYSDSADEQGGMFISDKGRTAS